MKNRNKNILTIIAVAALMIAPMITFAQPPPPPPPGAVPLDPISWLLLFAGGAVVAFKAKSFKTKFARLSSK